MPTDAKATEVPRFYIWWTSDLVAAEIGGHPKWSKYPGVPKYVQVQFSSRYGRAGRGRLWVARHIPVVSIPKNCCPSKCGGIVFEGADLSAMRQLPGFITEVSHYEGSRKNSGQAFKMQADTSASQNVASSRDGA